MAASADVKTPFCEDACNRRHSVRSLLWRTKTAPRIEQELRVTEEAKTCGDDREDILGVDMEMMRRSVARVMRT